MTQDLSRFSGYMRPENPNRQHSHCPLCPTEYVLKYPPVINHGKGNLHDLSLIFLWKPHKIDWISNSCHVYTGSINLCRPIMDHQGPYQTRSSGLFCCCLPLMQVVKDTWTRVCDGKSSHVPWRQITQWLDDYIRENLPETIDFPIEMGFSHEQWDFPMNNGIFP